MIGAGLVRNFLGQINTIQAAVLAQLAAAGGSSLVGYMQAGAGAVARTVQSLLRQTITPADFGAVGDGVTDDTAAIQAAITAAGASRVLDFGDLTYLCGELTFPNGIRWRGRGATLKCAPGATAANSWIRPIGNQYGGTVEGLTFDYQTNANGNHLLVLGTNARRWAISGCTFKNMKTKAALRADYAVAVAGDGFITVRGCRFEGGQGAGAFAFYAQAPGLGVRDITITDCDLIDCGGSMAHVAMINDADDAGAGRFGAFIGARIENCRFVGNGTGTFGAIPLELWGHDNLTVRGCVIDTATRGIGTAWCRNATLSGNAIRNQTIYAHELGVIDGLVITGESVENCQQFVMDTSATTGRMSRNIAITANVVKGTGLAAPAANTYAIQFAAGIAGQFRENIVIQGNKFSGLAYITGVMKLLRARHVLAAGNEYVQGADTEPVQFVNADGNADAVYRDNLWVRRANYNAATPSYDASPAVFTAPNAPVNVTFCGNKLISNAGQVDGSGFLGFGLLAAAAPYSGLLVQDNTLVGLFGKFFFINDNSGTAAVMDNDTTRGTEATGSAITVTYTRLSMAYDGTAAPAAGTYKRGDYVRNRNPAVGQPKGWVCTAAGTPGTWVSEGNL